MFPVIDLGPFAIQAGGFILILSFWLGIVLTSKYAKSLGTNDEVIENSLLYGLLGGILSARVGFFLQNPDLFIANPLDLFSLTPSMLDQSFGLLIGILIIFIISQKNHLPLWPTLDTLTPFLLILFTGIQIRNFATGNEFGLVAEIPWSIYLWGAMRHPVQIYSILIATPLIIWFLVKSKGLKSTGYFRSGLIFLVIIAALGGIITFTRAFTAEKSLIMGIDLIQLIGFGVISLSLFLIFKRAFESQKQSLVVISMGSNLNPEENLGRALEHIKSVFKFRRSSSIYKTEDVNAHPKSTVFLNQVVEINTDLTYSDLRVQLKLIENEFGRIKGDKQTVSLDLDILTYNGDVFEYLGKHIPDPNLIKYRYVAEPVSEMDPEFRHPGTGKLIQKILKNIPDKPKVFKLEGAKHGTEK
jgi:2-amino-4-hydroxy-6-hydroxymethyldihydropteridine diphosphokinase